MTPLHAAVKNHDLNMVKFLLSCDEINVELKTNDDQSPFEIAQRQFDFQMINLLKPYVNEPYDNYFYGNCYDNYVDDTEGNDDYYYDDDDDSDDYYFFKNYY